MTNQLVFDSLRLNYLPGSAKATEIRSVTLERADMISIESLELAGKKILIRSDMNVPFDEKGEISDDHRIKASLQTINFARECGASIIVCSHLGRPKGKVNEKLSLKPIASRMEKLMGAPVIMAPDCVGAEVESLVKSLEPGQVLLLENTRFHPEEESNEPHFSEQLAKLADVYVNDAFASCHRAHASTAGITEYVKEKAAGFTLLKEINFFKKAMANPQRPLAAIFGGAKVSTKMKAIKNVATKADMILVGGAMANTFFAALGHSVGSSLYEPEQLDEAKGAMDALKAQGCELILPVDVVVAKEFKDGIPTEAVAIDQIPEGMMALDIGPASIALFKEKLQTAKTIVWNGPMGAFEMDSYSKGTFAIVETLAESSALTVVGGGDTDLALERCHAFDKMDYVSTGGGAFLELLEGLKLPGVAVLEA